MSLSGPDEPVSSGDGVIVGSLTAEGQTNSLVIQKLISSVLAQR